MEERLMENLEAFNNVDTDNKAGCSYCTKADVFEILNDAYPLYHSISDNAAYYDAFSNSEVFAFFSI